MSNITIYNSHLPYKGKKVYFRELTNYSGDFEISLVTDLDLDPGDYFIIVETKTGWTGHKFKYASTTDRNEE